MPLDDGSALTRSRQMPSDQFAAGPTTKDEDIETLRLLRHQSSPFAVSGFLSSAKVGSGIARQPALAPFALIYALSRQCILAHPEALRRRAVRKGRRSTEEANDLIGNLGRRRTGIDRQRILA